MKKLLILVMFLAVLPCSLYAAFPVPYDEKLDVGSADKTFVLKENTVTVSATRPIKPLEEFTLTYTFQKPNVEKVEFSSNMEMYMGKYQYVGIKDPKSKNVFTVKQMLTKCMSGKTKWYTKADITYTSGKKETMYVFFDVK